MARCQACKKRQAIYAAQFIGEDVPTFSLLGSHYRGFKVIKVCEVCKDINVEGIRQAAQHGVQPTLPVARPQADL